ncbi:hypothetical protein Tco_0554010 [Tanacetum coccineum]
MHGEEYLIKRPHSKFLRKSVTRRMDYAYYCVRNKPEIETLSLDDLSQTKAYDSEVKGPSISTAISHNVAFLSTSSTNSATRAVNTTQGVNTASTRGAVDSSTTVDNLNDLMGNIAMLTRGQEDSLRILEGSWTWPTKKELGHPRIKTAGIGSLPEGLCQLRKLLQMPYYLSVMALDMIGVTKKKKNDFVSKSVVEKPTVETNEPKTARKEHRALIIEDWLSKSKEEDVPKVKTVEKFNKPSFAKINFVKSTKQVKSPRNTSVDKNRQNTPSPRGNKRNWN